MFHKKDEGIMTKIGHWFHSNYDYLTGGSFGLTTGIITIPSHISSVLFSIVLAFLTGIAGAIGAHLVRIVFDKLKLNKNG